MIYRTAALWLLGEVSTMKSFRLFVLSALLFPALVLARPSGPVTDKDTDGDGLSDFHERHKYRTDPSRRDTAGKGIPDGDWEQRRQFTYSVRAVIRVLPPCNLEGLTDDYQDVRVRAKTSNYVELEVVLYPFNTNAEAIRGNPTWKKDYAGMKEYLAPGITANWDERMRQDLLRELAQAGIEPERLADKEVVEKVSRWLFGRARYRNMFCTHYVHFPEGKPAVLAGLEKAFRRDRGEQAWTTAQQFEHELLGKEMFYRKSHGTCTSAAVYQCTVLRALGIPCRMIIAIPVVDASDEAQVELAEKGLKHHEVRHTVFLASVGAGQSYSSHTFCEVYVGRRWRRLNYTTLGQNILNPNYLGLMVKVHTFRDLSEANLAPTWGRRYALGLRDKDFAHSNPYRTLAVSDLFGKYAKVPNPPYHKEHHRITLSKVYWWNSDEGVRRLRDFGAKAPADGAGHLLVHGDEWFENAADYLQYKAFMKRSDRDFIFRAKGQPDVKGALSMTFFTHASTSIRELEIIIPPAELAKMARGVPYTLQPRNSRADFQWRVTSGLTITRP
jgi:hypothetical protein